MTVHSQKLFLCFCARLRLRGFFLSRRFYAFARLVLDLLLCSFLLLFLLRFSRLSRFNRNFVRKHNANVTGALQNPAGTSTSARHDPFQRWTLADNSLFHYQRIWFEIGIVFCIGDCALQRFANEKRRLLRRESQQIECCRNRQTLNLTRDFARLKRRNPRVLICRSHFHFRYSNCQCSFFIRTKATQTHWKRRGDKKSAQFAQGSLRDLTRGMAL